MAVCDEIGDRMKSFYEGSSKTKLVRRVPVILRVDGKAFKTFTKGFFRPFDGVLIRSMQDTARYLCENIQGCRMAYTESDEISLLLTDYDKIDTDAWFDYEVQKLCSITASMATLAFNRALVQNARDFYSTCNPENKSIVHVYDNAVASGAVFDCKAFNIPKEEITNYFYWRQTDAVRNSVSMVARCYFSTSELDGKSTKAKVGMLEVNKDVKWGEFDLWKQRGSTVIKKPIFIPESQLEFKPKSEQLEEYNGQLGIWRRKWVNDLQIPLFKNEGRNYIESLI
jgi:tRNA(His) 5'-end guanylyltransferase